MRREINYLVGADWQLCSPGFQEAISTDDRAQLVEIPLVHIHREVFAVTTFENIDTQIRKMVLVWALSFAFFLHRGRRFAESAKKDSTNRPRHTTRDDENILTC
jgi:hypothetical protein